MSVGVRSVYRKYTETVMIRQVRSTECNEHNNGRLRLSSRFCEKKMEINHGYQKQWLKWFCEAGGGLT